MRASQILMVFTSKGWILGIVLHVVFVGLSHALPGNCTVSKLGQPCPSGGVSTQGPVSPVLNLGVGNPINLVSGNKYQRDIDLAAPSGRVGLEIVRHYNAQDPRPSLLGRGWVLSYETRLYPHVRPGQIQIAQADGSRVDFRCEGAVLCQPVPPAQGRLYRHKAEWRWHWPDGRRLHFDSAGRLVHIKGPYGDQVIMTRETRPGPTQGAILEVSDTSARVMRFEYEIGQMGARLARINTPAGSYVYLHDQPSTVTLPSLSSPRLIALHHPGGWRREYLYEPVRQGENPFQLTGIAVQQGEYPAIRTHTWAYDKQGRAVLSVQGPPESTRARLQIHYVSEPTAADIPGLTRVASAAGMTEFHTAWRPGRAVLTRIQGVGCPGCSMPGLEAEYDTAGHLTRLNRLQLQRDDAGRLRRLHDGESGWPGLMLSFDAQGQLNAWETTATGQEQQRHNQQGHLVERRYANGDLWQYQYDAAGHPREIVARAQNETLRTTMDWRDHHVVQIEHPHEQETRRYDGQHRLIARHRYRPARTPGEVAYHYQDGFEWDSAGRMRRHTLPEGGELVYDYDAAGHLSRIVWQDGVSGARTLLQAAPGSGYLQVNGLRTRGLLRQARLDVLMVDNPQAPQQPPIFMQQLKYDSAGRIVNERLWTGSWRTAWAYAYDRDSRMLMANAKTYGVFEQGRGQVLEKKSEQRARKRPGSNVNQDLVLVSERRSELHANQMPEQMPKKVYEQKFRQISGQTLGPKAGQTFVPPFEQKEISWLYAWQAAGDLHARRYRDVTQFHHPHRDASGLPRDHAHRQLYYGPNRRLQRVAQAGVMLASYTYNAYGERIRRHTAQGVTDYFYAQNRLVAQARPLPQGGMGITHRYIYAGWVPVAVLEYQQPAPINQWSVIAANHQPPAPFNPRSAIALNNQQAVIARNHQEPPPSTQWPAIVPNHQRPPGVASTPRFYAIHADALGQPHVMTDEHSRIRWRAIWSPTGAAVAMDGEMTLPLRQPGHVFDEATGWHDNYLRTYDPEGGHYLEPDPVGPLAGSQAYGYAAQQPRRYIDPWGLLLFAFDGTSRDWSARTNVSLMSRQYAAGPMHYHHGPGLAKRQRLDVVTAESAPDIINKQWQALLGELARPHDGSSIPIDLLGYSRGAALALHFSNMIADHSAAGRFWTRDASLGTVTACVDLRFIGLFDTVAQFGLLGNNNHQYNLALATEWRYVAHAVALHERRRLFPLTTVVGDADRVIVGTFIGAHGDIGGGYLAEPANVETAQPGGDLSDVTLNWMMKQAQLAGVPFHPLPAAFRRVSRPILHDERSRVERRIDTDRAVLAGTEPMLKNQADHPHHGNEARAEAETFIHRVKDWQRSSELEVGVVDLSAYQTWLQQTLAWDLPLER